MDPRPDAPAFRRDPFGLAALLLGAAGVLVHTAAGLAQPLIARDGGVSAIVAVAVAGLSGEGLLGLLAVVLGLVGLLRRRPRSATAAAGVAVGAVLLVGVGAALLGQLLFTLVRAVPA